MVGSLFFFQDAKSRTVVIDRCDFTFTSCTDVGKHGVSAFSSSSFLRSKSPVDKFGLNFEHLNPGVACDREAVTASFLEITMAAIRSKVKFCLSTVAIYSLCIVAKFSSIHIFLPVYSGSASIKGLPELNGVNP